MTAERSALAPTGIEFLPNGDVGLTYYVLPDDARANGMFVQRRIHVPGDLPELADELEDLVRTIQRTLKVALEVLEEAEPADEALMAAEIDDDRPSPYDNPNERDLSEVASPRQGDPADGGGGDHPA